jgi:Tfp pilus assembly protein PilX
MMQPLKSERGIALVLALFLVSVLSILGASMMFLSQTETYASQNYRMMSQARYAAESGVHKAGNFLMDPTQYAVPGSVSDPLTNYDRTKSPVVCVAGCPNVGQAVVLSAGGSIPANYPVSAVVTAFGAAAQGTLAAGNTTLTYKTSATLVAMRVVDAFGGTQNVVQTWQITSDGGLKNSPKAVVEVVSTVSQPVVPANSYGAFATANTCGALYFHGNVQTNSYDSTGLHADTTPTMDNMGGDIGTNGNMEIQGSVNVDGNMYSPKTGVGACSAGNVTAQTDIGNAMSINCPDGETGSDPTNACLVQLPTVAVYPVPTMSVSPSATTTVTIGNGSSGSVAPSGACAAFGLTSPTCTFNSAAKTVTLNGGGTDITLPNVVVNSNYSLIIQGNAPAQNVNINSFGGGGNVTIQANSGTTVAGVLTDVGQSVVLKVAGKNPDGTDMATPFNLGDWSISSDFAFDASNLQIVYGGTAAFSMTGNSSAAATIYAPNASFQLQGNSSFYGSILANTITNGGTPSIFYDRKLQHDFFIAGTPALGSFTWSRY